MTYILLSVVCSVIVSVLLKLAPRFRIDVRLAIAGGYLVAALLCITLFDASLMPLWQTASPAAWGILVSLGILLPGIFLVLAKSVDCVGMVRTDAAQRLSLVLPLIAAFTLFGEALSWQKTAGILLGLLAIACIVTRTSQTTIRSATHNWVWPAGVFAGLGAIDILFKLLAQLARVPFTSVLLATFLLAFVLSLLYVGVLAYRDQLAVTRRQLWGPLLLGCFNFGNILFYVEAHQQLSRDPALVFSTMNIGVIVLAAFIGMVAFKERLSRLNLAGVAMAIAAVLVLTGA